VDDGGALETGTLWPEGHIIVILKMIACKKMQHKTTKYFRCIHVIIE
jgi:hypothetical protein